MYPESPLAHMKGQTPEPQGEKPAEKSQAELREALHEKFKSAKALFDSSLADFRQALKDGDFEDKEGEAPGTGQVGRQAFEKKVRGHLERATRLSDALKSSEPVTEQMLKSFEDRPHVDYAAFVLDVDPTKAGEQWDLNDESDYPDFEKAKPFIPDLSAFAGKPYDEVFQHILDTYGDTHYIPGEEYRDWFVANPEKTPPELNNREQWVYFPGSIIRGRTSNWCVPSAYFSSSTWGRATIVLGSEWSSGARVVLLEK